MARWAQVLALLAVVFSVACSARSKVDVFPRADDSVSCEFHALPRHSRLGFGRVIPVDFELVNTGTSSIAGCTSHSRGYAFSASRATKSRILPTPGSPCPVGHRFLLPPANSLRWTEPVEVLDVGLGPAEFEAWIDVYRPPPDGRAHRATPWTVRSEPVPVAIERPSRGPWGNEI